jgi:hypothetical protein
MNYRKGEIFMKGKEMVLTLKEEKNPSKLARIMQDFVNKLIVDIDGFVEALKKEEESVKIRFATISLLWVKKLNFYKKEEWYDLRNEYSVETCEKIQHLLGNDLESFMPDYQGFIDEEQEIENFEILFVEEMGRAHRTLQQTFSGIVFKWLRDMHESLEDEFFIDISQRIKSSFSEEFYRTPMI